MKRNIAFRRDPFVYIVVLNWNGWRLTVECLQSLAALDYPNYRVLVVDNGSTDDSVDHLKLFRPDLELVETGENLGFTGGCNTGMERALKSGAEYVLLLNNDAKAAPEMLSRFVDAAVEADAAICGARVLNEAGTRILFDGEKWPWTIFGLHLHPPVSVDAMWSDSDRVEGSAMLLRRDLLEQCLLERTEVFLTDFFMYCEETELCRYALSMGYRCVIVRKAIAFHALAKSSGGKGSSRPYYYLTRNRIYLANRWLSPIWKILFHFYYAPSRLLLQIRRNHAARAAVWQGLRDGYRGVKGMWNKHGR